MCHKGGVRRPRDFASIAAYLSGREIGELRATEDARREARAGRGDTSRDGGPTQAGAAGLAIHEGGRRAI